MVRVKRLRMMILPPPPPVPTDVLDRLDPGVLCQDILGGVPAEQFEGAMYNLASNFLQVIAGYGL